METGLKTILIGIAVVLLMIGLFTFSQHRSDRRQIEHTEPTSSDLPRERSEKKLWSPQTEALVDTFPAKKSDLEALREMMAVKQLIGVSLLGDDLRIDTVDGRRFDNEDVEDHGQWLALMGKTNMVSIANVNALGMDVFFPRPPRTTPDRYETINYYFNHRVPAKQCSDQFRDIPCGVCDVLIDDNWSIRHSWSSGEFEIEYSESFAKVYQDNESNLSIEQISAKRDESRQVCMQRGLEKMGYEHPEYY